MMYKHVKKKHFEFVFLWCYLSGIDHFIIYNKLKEIFKKLFFKRFFAWNLISIEFVDPAFVHWVI